MDLIDAEKAEEEEEEEGSGETLSVLWISCTALIKEELSLFR